MVAKGDNGAIFLNDGWTKFFLNNKQNYVFIYKTKKTERQINF